MFALLVLSVISVAVASPVSVNERAPAGYAKPLNVSEANVKITFYSRKIPSGVLLSHSNYKTSLASTDFDSSKRTIFIVHGWRNDITSPVCVTIREAYLHVTDANVFVVDWGTIACEYYYDVVDVLPQLATILGKIVDNMVSSSGLRLDDTTLVGHSLGAHISGMTGAHLGGKVNVIVGLDPAGPGFNQDKVSLRLNPSNAKFVQALHTCQGNLGINITVGHADYIANNGNNQPGCFLDIMGACAHGRAFEYFTESILGGKFVSLQCDDYMRYMSGACKGHKTSNMGGLKIDTAASGSYVFLTNSSPPYAKS